METILSLIVALGGLLLSAITIILNHGERAKTRTSAYREALYAKQVESISQLFVSFHITATLSEALRAALQKGDETIITHFTAELERKHRETFELLAKITPFLPNSAMNAATRYLGLFAAMIGFAETNDGSSIDTLLKAIRTAEIELTLESRKVLGTDTLSSETLNLFSKSESPNYSEVLAHYSNGYDAEFKDT
jgi:hypothetical protein